MTLPVPDFDSLLANYQTNQRDGQTNPIKKTESVPIAKQHGKTCSVCNIVFPSRDKLYIHLSNHVSCEFDGCDFVGTSKTLSEHRQEKHDVIAAKLFKMDSPELLAAWISQRKKNFPTRHNIENKLKCKKMRIERGIVACDKTFSFKGGKQWSVKRENPYLLFGQTSGSENTGGLVTGNTGGLGSTNTGGLVSQNALGLDQYDSSEEEGEIVEPEGNSEGQDKSVLTTDENTRKIPDKHLQTQLKKFKQYAKILSSDGRKKKPKKVWNGVLKSGRRRYQPTLLQKLLASEIKNEHNNILQCIRYIVKNNFLQDR